MSGADYISWTGASEFRPIRHYEGDAGFDLFADGDYRVPGGEFTDIGCGISIALPYGIWAMVTGRSSTLKNRKLLVAQGILDNGYRGPIFFGVQNLNGETVEVKKGERLAQLIPFALEADRLSFRKVEQLGYSARGQQSFGSTGT